MDEKFKKDFVELLDQQFDQKFIRMFNQGFEEVVLPQIESLKEEMNQKFEGVDERFNKVESQLERLEFKVDRIADNQLEDRSQLKEHGARIKKLEAHRPAA